MQALRVLVVVMGVMIVLGMVALGVLDWPGAWPPRRRP